MEFDDRSEKKQVGAAVKNELCSSTHRAITGQRAF